MSERNLLLAVAVCALVVAVATGYAAHRSIAELRDGQMELVRELGALKAERRTAAAVAPDPTPHSYPGASAAPGSSAPIDSEEIEALRRRIEELEASDPTEVARIEAVERVGRLEGRARAKALKNLELLVALGDDDARRVAIGGLSDADPRVREAALKVLARAGDPALIDRLEPLVRDPSPDVRTELADALEDASADRAGPLLMALLEDPNPRVVEDAVKALGALRYEPARERLVEFVDPEDPKLTGAVGEALRAFGDEFGAEEAIATLASALEHEDPAVRRRAVKELGQIGGPSARAHLEAALEDTDADVQREARKRLAKL